MAREGERRPGCCPGDYFQGTFVRHGGIPFSTSRGKDYERNYDFADEFYHKVKILLEQSAEKGH
jgi:hypothetical protein